MEPINFSKLILATGERGIGDLLFYAFGAMFYLVSLYKLWGVIVKRSLIALSEWFERVVLRKKSTKRNVFIIIDHKKHQRTCFWKKLFKKHSLLNKHLNFRFVSIGDEIDHGCNPATFLFHADNLQSPNIIICNWDVLNGDPVYDSDRTQSFFSHYRFDLNEWLCAGGILIVESQGASWDPTATPYSTFTKGIGGETVSVKPDDVANPVLKISEQAIGFPGTDGLTPAELTVDKECLGRTLPWFSSKCGPPSVYFKSRGSSSAIRGFFSEWSDWRPILVRQKDESPVMIWRRAKDEPDSGGILLTTMFLAASSLDSLIVKLLIELPEELSKWHDFPNKKDLKGPNKSVKS